MTVPGPGSTSAGGTRVVLPAPGIAVTTAARASRTRARISSRYGSIGSGSRGTVRSYMLTDAASTARIVRAAMRNRSTSLRSAVALLIASSSIALTALDRAAEPTLAIYDVTVIDGAGAPPRPGMTVLVEQDRISAIGPVSKTEVPPDTPVITGTGKFLIPALWDMHAHVANQGADSLTTDVILPMFTAFGIVGVRDMGGAFDRIERARIDMRQGRLQGPLVISPGPFLDGPQQTTPIVMPVTDEESARDAVRKLVERHVDFVKVQSGLSREAWRAAGSEARRHGLVFAGHVPEAVSASEVVGSGQASIEHVSPVLPGDAGLLLACSAKEDELRRELLAIRDATHQPNANAAELRTRQDALQLAMFDTYDAARATALFRRMMKEKVVSVPTLVWSQTIVPTTREEPADLPLQAIPRVMRDRWFAARKRYFETSTDERLAHNARLAKSSIEFVRKMHDVGVTILAGTDSLDTFVLPGFSLHQELELLVRAGFSPMSALQSATRDAARYFGQERERGTVQKGKMADLLLLDADPLADIRNTRRIFVFIRGGDVLTRADLAALLPARP
jgi:amidohydrolase family protein